jgi:hypothetical protein
LGRRLALLSGFVITRTLLADAERGLSEGDVPSLLPQAVVSHIAALSRLDPRLHPGLREFRENPRLDKLFAAIPIVRFRHLNQTW